MLVRYLVLHDLLNVFASILKNQIAATRMVFDEVGYIKHSLAYRYVAGLAGIVRLDV